MEQWMSLWDVLLDAAELSARRESQFSQNQREVGHLNQYASPEAGTSLRDDQAAACFLRGDH
jgi:hypothetical protein